MDAIPIFGYSWRKKYYLNDENYYMYYFSLCINEIPVYRIKIKKTNEVYDIYKINDVWKISSSFCDHKALDYSIKNSLHVYIPPIEGWHLYGIQDIFSKIIPKYYNQLSKYDDNFKFFKIKYSKYLNIKSKEKLLAFILSLKRFSVFLPQEMVLMILNNIRIAQLNK